MYNTFLTISEAANLEGKNESTIKRHIKDSKLDAIASSGSRGGAGGITYRIPLDALPVEAQVRYWMSRDNTEAGDADIAGYRERYGEAGLKELLRSQAAAREVIGRLSGMLRGRGAVYEEAAKRYGVSTRTIRRWESAYREKGLKGLMKPLERADKGESRTICAWAGDFLKHMYVGGQVGGIGGGNAKICQQSAAERLKEEAERLGENACDMCPYCAGSSVRSEMSRAEREKFPECDKASGHGMIVPNNRYAVNRYMAQIPQALKDFGRYGDRYWAAHHMQKARRDKPTRVNECWFGDHHRFDIFVLGEDGVPFRPWLTAWTDACSGEFVGWMLTAEPSSDTIAESFCRAAAYTRGSDIHGLPGAVYVDNGKDYRSSRFERGKLMDRELGRLNARFDPDGEESGAERTLLEMLGVAMIRAKPYQGWSKTIERIFGIIEKQHWIRELPGWCGDSPDERPQNLGIELSRLQKDGKMLTFEQFAEIWATKILPEYRAHKGADGRSPGEIYASAERYPMPTPNWDTLALMKSQTVQRKVETTGIRFQNQRYWNEILSDYIGQYVTVRYNRGYCESVTVMHERHFVCEAEVAENLKLVGEDNEKIAEHMKAQARQRAKVTGEIKRLRQSTKGLRTRAAYVEEIDEQRDMAEATLVSTEGRRAARAKAEAADRRAGKKKAADAGAGAVVSMLERRGAALAEQDAAEW